MKSSIVSTLALAFFASLSFAGSPVASPDKNPQMGIADSAWSSTLLGAGIKTNDNYTDGNFFLTIPIWSTIGRDGRLGGNYLFIEPYSSVGTGGEVAASLGLSYRHLFSNQPNSALESKGRAGFMEEGWFLGGNFFVDMLDTQHRNSFWQLGVGGEVGNRYVELRGNYYIPLTGEQLAQRNVSSQSFSSTSNSNRLTSADDPFAAGNTILQNATYGTFATTTTTTVRTVTELFEKGMQGWDAELSVLVPWVDQWMDVKLIGGYFSFDNQPFGPQEFGTGNVHGWKGGVEVRPVPAVVLSGTWYEDKRLTGGNWTMGVQLQVPLDRSWRDAFTMRRRHLVEHLAEPVHRQNDAVKMGNREEQTSTVSVKRSTRVVKQTPRQIVLKDDVIFVNNGGDVKNAAGAPNGIKAGNSADTGTGTAQDPTYTIQHGANIAGTNSNNTSRVWNVYTQGGSNKFVEADYGENVVAIGSTNFIGSGKLIPGLGGKSFGTGNKPVLGGSINSNAFGFLGVSGYFVAAFNTGVHGINATGVNTVFLDSNEIAFILSANAINVTNPATLTVTHNNIHDITSGIGLKVLLDDGAPASSTANISGNQFTTINGNSVDLQTFSSSQLTAYVNNNDFHGSTQNYLFTASHNTSTLIDAVFENKFHSANGDAIKAESFDDSTNGLIALGNEINNQIGNGIHVLSHDTSSLIAVIGLNTLNNTILTGILAEADNTGASGAADGINLFINAALNTIDGTTIGSGISLQTSNKAILSADPLTSISGLADAIAPFVNGPFGGTLDSLLSGISGNTIKNVNGQGVALASRDSSTLNATVQNNVIDTPANNGIEAESEDSSHLTLKFLNNTVKSPSLAGVCLDSSGTSVLTSTIRGNSIDRAFWQGIEVMNNASSHQIADFSSNTITNTSINGVAITTSGASALFDGTFNSNSISLSGSNGISLSESAGTLNLNGTLNNSVTGSGNKTLNVNGTTPTGTIILNGSPVSVGSDVP